MRHIYTTIFLSLILYIPSFSQSLVAYRVAELKRTNYDITGKAFLEEFDDGSISIRLDEDYNTDSGPDVRLFLSESSAFSGSLQVADLSEEGHFSGEASYDISEDIQLDDYDYVLFRCVAFAVSWAEGSFGPVMTPAMCEESATATTGWGTEVSICPTDNQHDSVPILNNLFIDAGENYAFIITDTNELIQEVVYADIYDFEGSGLNPQRVYGVHFFGDLENVVIGEHRETITATECHQHSGGDFFLTITKDACITSTYAKFDDRSNILYPNPVNDVLSIALEKNVDMISIYDVNGVLIEQIYNRSNLQLSHLHSGIYRINILDKNGETHVSSFIKE